MTIKEENPLKDDSMLIQARIDKMNESESFVENKDMVMEPFRSESSLNRLLNWSKKNRGNRRAVDSVTFRKYVIPSLEEFDVRISKIERMSSSIPTMERYIQMMSEKMMCVGETAETYSETIDKNIKELQMELACLQETINKISNKTDICNLDNTGSIIKTTDSSVDELRMQLDQMDAQVKRLTVILMRANQAFSDISEPEDVGTNFAEAFRNGYSRALENMPWLSQIRNMLANGDIADNSAILSNIKTLIVANITAHEVHDGEAFDPLRMCIVSREVTMEREEIGTIRIVGNPHYYTVWDDNLGEQTLEKCRVIVKVGDDDE